MDLRTMKPIAKAFCIDTEQKVVKSLAKQRSWSYSDRRKVTLKSGAANNWAYGYFKLAHKAIDMLDQEFVRLKKLLSSLSGGTGSGIGTYVTEILRLRFPGAFIINQVIWPFLHGEVVLQHYNILLSLSHLNKASDLILIHENDDLTNICKKRFHIENVTFKDMNKWVIRCLMQVLLPVENSDCEEFRRKVYGNTRKCYLIYSAPQISEDLKSYSNFDWKNVAKNCIQMALTKCATDEGISWYPSQNSVQNYMNMIIILRGPKSLENSENFQSYSPHVMYNEVGMPQFKDISCTLLV
ncbi:tubulin nucleotide-binding domain-like protein [Rozella allomycis CSF55]|uniref:Tubulin delta chain n=1 Tax=Rozella allomycis (strain CSF55) TaxID=988480 RepID=A0A075B141_ROZAC|nr:Tubulin/FtsZ, GTPase domain-containing protein [Rozella allomycis CSF55]RKP22052.1 tubulin nucleotide-binding domain-like protein [Rozella allomycis CSF55]|eukprot:EPZ34661.1 Tubulin/FtsZ, GTPase domain-containing protein [Rozella allomycis CSF55]